MSPSPILDSGTPNGADVVQPLHPFGIGIDTHKAFIQVCILINTGTGVIRKEDEFTTAWPQLKLAREWCEKVIREHHPTALMKEPFRYVIESTGTYHLPVVRAFGGEPHIINPLLAGSTRRKTDVLDARMLAHHSLCGLWAPSFIVSDELEVLRMLLRERSESVRSATRSTNRINNLLLRFGHTIGREASLRDSIGRALAEDLIEGRIPKHASVCPDGLPVRVRRVCKSLYADFDEFRIRAKEAEDRAIEHGEETLWPIGSSLHRGRDIVKNLMTVPQIGKITALWWLATIGDPTRFTSSNQVAAYCGSDPSLKVSAGKVTQHIRRKGHAKLAAMLKMCSARLLRRADNPVGQWGYSIWKRGGKKGFGVACNAVARRLAIFLWHVHRTGEPFDMTRYKFYLVPKVIDMPIEEMELPTRLKNILIENGCKSSQEVAELTTKSIHHAKGIGETWLNALRTWIKNHELPKSRPSDCASPAKSQHGANEHSSTKRLAKKKASSSTKSRPIPRSTRSKTGKVASRSRSAK